MIIISDLHSTSSLFRWLSSLIFLLVFQWSDDHHLWSSFYSLLWSSLISWSPFSPDEDDLWRHWFVFRSDIEMVFRWWCYLASEPVFKFKLWVAELELGAGDQCERRILAPFQLSRRAVSTIPVEHPPYQQCLCIVGGFSSEEALHCIAALHLKRRQYPGCLHLSRWAPASNAMPLQSDDNPPLLVKRDTCNAEQQCTEMRTEQKCQCSNAFGLHC